MDKGYSIQFSDIVKVGDEFGKLTVIGQPFRLRRETPQRFTLAVCECKCAADWGDDPRAAVSGKIIAERLRAGWDHEKAITKPRRKL